MKRPGLWTHQLLSRPLGSPTQTGKLLRCTCVFVTTAAWGETAQSVSYAAAKCVHRFLSHCLPPETCPRGDDPTTTYNRDYAITLTTDNSASGALSGSFGLWFNGRKATTLLGADGEATSTGDCEAVRWVDETLLLPCTHRRAVCRRFEAYRAF